jgi:hypothetical protein
VFPRPFHIDSAAAPAWQNTAKTPSIHRETTAKTPHMRGANTAKHGVFAVKTPRVHGDFTAKHDSRTVNAR